MGLDNAKRAAARRLQPVWMDSLVGVAGFELATPCTPCKCATRLRYAPSTRIIGLASPASQGASRPRIESSSWRTWAADSVNKGASGDSASISSGMVASVTRRS